MPRLISFEAIKTQLEEMPEFKRMDNHQKELVLEHLRGMAAVNKGNVPAEVLKIDIKRLAFDPTDKIQTSTVKNLEKAIKQLVNPSIGLRRMQK